MTPASCDTFANLSNEATRISGQKSQHGEEAKMQVDALACSAAQRQKQDQQCNCKFTCICMQS